MQHDHFFPDLYRYCSMLEADFAKLTAPRQDGLRRLAEYVLRKNVGGGMAKLTVICTHNSRRSHFGQAWLAAAARWHGLRLEAYSGGTEATAFHPNSVAALRRCGFGIEQETMEANPRYLLRAGAGEAGMLMFSKRFDDHSNPESGFGAVMVCTDADEACPFVPGAEARFSLPFEDPKHADGSLMEAAVYDERCRQVAVEMFFAAKLAAGIVGGTAPR